MGRRRRHSLHRWKYENSSEISPALRCSVFLSVTMARANRLGRKSNKRARWNETRVVRMNSQKKEKERKREKEKRKERSTRQKKNCASLKKRPAVLVNHADAIPRYVSLENFLSPGAMLPSTAMFLFRVARKNEICSPLHCAT